VRLFYEIKTLFFEQKLTVLFARQTEHSGGADSMRGLALSKKLCYSIASEKLAVDFSK